MSYKTLLKFGTVPYRDSELIIDGNPRVDACVKDAISRYGMRHEAEEGESFDGFQEGLAALGAEKLDGLLNETGPVMKANEAEMAQLAEEKALAEQELNGLMEQIEAARAEAARIIEQAQNEAGGIRDEARKAGHDEGYNLGQQEAQAAYEAKENALDMRREQLEQEYEDRFNAMEPEFIDHLTAIYEHVFHVDLLDHRGVLLYLIEKTMRDVGANSNFLIHVSPADFPMVQAHKGELASSMEGNHTLEIVEDGGLGQGGAMVETENGIFDCGIDTELKELTRKLKLLSFEKS